MDRRFRTVALAAASLGLLVSLFGALRPSDDDETAPTPASQLTATAAAEPPPKPITSPSPVETPLPVTPTPAASDVVTIRLAVRTASAGTVRRLSVRRGRKLELVVASELADHVHVHGYDLTADVAPGKPATIEFTADAPGRFEIELESRGLPIGELEVRP